jgi:VWFA-related protein
VKDVPLVFRLLMYILVFFLIVAHPRAASLTVTQIDESEFPSILAFISVLDNSRKPIDGLSINRVKVLEDSKVISGVKLMPASDLAGGSDVVLVVDNSGSMKVDDRYLDVLYATKNFIKVLKPEDRAAIVFFGDSVEVKARFTNLKDRLVDNVSFDSFGSKDTRLYEAIFDALDLLGNEGRNRKAVIVLTDGYDIGSALTADDCIKKANAQNTPIFTLGFGERDKIKEQPLARIAKLTGGEYLIAQSSNDLAQLYIDIGSQLRDQYAALKFVSIAEGDGQWHELQVVLNLDNQALVETKNYMVPIIATPVPWRKYLYGGLGGAVVIVVLATITLIKTKKKEALVEDSPDFGHNKFESDEPVISDEVNEEGSSDTVVRRVDPMPKSDQTQVLDSKDAGIKNIDNKLDYGTKIILNESPTMAWLMIKKGTRRGQEYPLSGERSTIGRSQGNDIAIEDDYASREHAIVSFKSGEFQIVDAVSTHGTKVSGVSINVPTTLNDGDEIDIGNTTLVFKRVTLDG